MKLNYSVFRTMILSTMLLCGMVAEARVISGTVKDPTGETIISASVVVQGTTIGTVTDFDGNYTLEVPDDAKVLVFSYIGMQTQELAITGDVLNVVLSENSEVLEEVVVTGYGTTKKRDLVTAVSSVNADQLKDIPVASAAEALQGKLAGVSVTTTEGSPDAEVKIRVRGGTSLTQNNDPLYIVDGMPVSSISDIAPSDIASMDVLKDAAATAIYGAQGANGVIIITTKDADTDNEDKMVLHFDYTGYAGVRKLANRVKTMNNRDFMLMQYENAYLKASPSELAKGLDKKFYEYFIPNYEEGTGDIVSMLEGANDLERTDWLDKTFGRTGFDSNHSFTISGGNKNGSFNLNYSRVDNKAIMLGSNYHRNSLALKAKFKPIKNMTIAFNTRYSDTEVNGSGSNAVKDEGGASSSESRLRNAVVYTPIELTKTSSGDVEDTEDQFGNLYKPTVTIHDNYKHKKDMKLNLNGYISYKFAKYFTWKSEVGYDYKRVGTNRYYGPTTTFSKQYCPEKGYALVIKELNTKFRQTNTFLWEQKFNNAHNTSILVGEEIVISRGNDATQTFVGFDKSLEPSKVFNLLGSAEASTSKNYINPNDNMLSFFARANYDYKSRYYISLTFRADGSSRFAKNHRWGYFPSAAVAWNIAEESFAEPAQKWMSQLKLRFSYGTAGNNQVNLGYLYPDYNSSIAATSGASPWMDGFTTMWTAGGGKHIAANPNLKWETTITRNLGIDYGFFNQRLSGTIDLYMNTTKDLIVLYGLAQAYNYQYRNIGSTENRGIEFSVNGVILDKKTKDLHYNLTISANIAANQNKVKSLGGLEYLDGATNAFSTGSITQTEFYAYKGQSLGKIYGYKTDGYYAASDFKSYNSNTRTWRLENGVVKQHTDLGAVYPGMIKLKEAKGAEDGQIDDKDRVCLGSTLPKASGGFAINFNIGGDKWGQVDFGANFTYSIGNKVLNLNKLDWTTIGNADDKTSYRNMLTTMNYGNRYSMFDADGTYLPNKYLNEGDDFATMVAKLDAANAGVKIHSPYMKAYVVTDEIVEDGSFLRLNQLTIGYSLSKKWLEKAYITKCRIYVQATNLFCITKYSGFDPEVDVYGSKNPLCPGVDFSAYPKSRGYNVGVNLSF